MHFSFRAPVGRFVTFTSAFALLLVTGSAFAGGGPLTGTQNIPGSFANLDAAITALNTFGVGPGGVTLNVLAGNPQTTPAGGYAITATGTAANPITIQCNANNITAFTPQTSGSFNDGIFKLIGADFVTIANCVMLENAANTTTAAATNNMTEWGVALLYATATDGAQNDTIQGNTIDLDRTYANTFGVYANATHTAALVTATASATGAAGGNTGLKVYTNNITDVNMGVVVVGATAAADYNDNIEIGGTAGQGNNITNFGTTGTFSGFVNVATNVNGVLMRNTRNFTIASNTITSSAGGTTAGALNGIQLPSFSVAPAGTFTHNINNNQISVRSGAAGGAITSILINTLTASATSTMNINGNTFTNTGHTVAGTAAVNFISNVPTGGTQQITNINNNTFSALSFNTTSGSIAINNSFTHAPNSTINVNNNIITGGFTKTGVGNTVRGYENFGSTTTGTEVNTGNNFSGMTVTGSTVLFVWRTADGATPFPSKTVTNNTFTNTTGGTGLVDVLQVGFSSGGTVSGNTITGVSGTGSAVTGISSTAGTQTFSGNTVSAMANSGTGLVSGFSITGATNQTLIGNKIFDLANTNAGGLVNGIAVTAGTTVNLTNNLIADLRAPIVSAANAVIGINLTSTATVSNLNVSYNTVLLAATSTGTNFGSSAVSHTANATATTAALNLRNNVLINNSTPAGTGLVVALRRSAVTLGNYGASSNNNDFFAGTPGAANLIFSDGTAADQTLAAFKARVATRDSASVTEAPPFLSTSGASPQFLHINPAVATQLESGGAPIAGITTDFDGDTRSATSPDIGGDEFAGIVLDLTPPSIGFTALLNTTLTANRALAITTTDASPIAGSPNGPRVYFRKNAGAYVSTACAGAAPNFTCTIDNALLSGVVVGDTINYFAVAQDAAGNVGANPNAGFAATNVNSVTTPPSNPATYTIVAGASGTITVGTGGTFASLTNVGGIFESLNGAVVTGNVTIDILSNLTGEAGTVALNQLAEEGAGAGTYTVTIRPSGAPRTIAGTGTGAVLIKLNGADRVTIDGSTSGGSDRSLSITNGFASTTASVVWIASTAAGNPATNNTVKNTIIAGGSSTTTLAGVVTSGSVLGGVAEAQNNNTTISNNAVSTSQYAIASVGPTGNENGLMISNNTIGSTVAAQKMGFNGIAVFQQAGATVSNNTITGVVTATTSTTSGIRVAGTANGITIAGNRISDIKNTNATGFGSNGIQLNSSSPLANVTVVNNAIWDVSAVGFDGFGVGDNGWGIIALPVTGPIGGGYNIWFNTVSMSTNQTIASSRTAALNLASGLTAGSVDVRNNIFANNETVGTRYGIANLGAVATFSTINRNDYFAQNVGIQGATALPTLASWQASTGQDANSLAADPLLVSATDLHLQGLASPAAGAGAPIAGVTIDFDGDTRPSNPDIGADEIIGPNATPTISAVAVSRHEGDAATLSTIANVDDSEDAENTLAVTVNGGATATVNNVTVSGISTSAAGVVTANVVAACTATSASFTLRVTDSATAFSEATLNVTVIPNVAPTLSYPATTNAVFGQSLNVNPATGPTDDAAVTSIVVQSPGSYSGGATVDNAGVVALTGAQPVGSHTIVIRASDACTFTDANLALVVAKADTLATIVSDSPDPSTVGQAVTVVYTVTPVAPGAGTPTGNVTVTDGVDSCIGTIAAGQCTVSLNTTGVRTLTAAYLGDANFNGNTSAGAGHSVGVANSAPTIAAVGVTRRAGDASASATIANVNDAEDAETSLVVTVNSGATATVNGVTVSGISTNAAGTTSASVVAACGATTANFTLRVTDSGALFNEATLAVTVNPNLAPVLTYAATTNAVFGQTLNVNPATGPTDSGTISTIVVQSAGTFTGTSSVNSGGVVALGNAAPVGTHTIVIRATDNCNAQTDANLSLVVGQAATTTTITSDAPDPSNAGQNVVVQYTVAVTAPGSGTPAGNVTVSDGVNNCTGTVAAGQCTVALNTPGNRTLTATYAATTNFAGSNGTTPHVVNSTTDLRITKTSNLSQVGTGLVQYTVAATNLGVVGVTGATVVDNLPALITSATWTCTGSGGGTCTASGGGNINQSVNLPVGGTVTFAISGTVPTSPPPGAFSNTATVASSVAVTDTNLANNTATVNDAVVLFRNGFEDGPGNRPAFTLESPQAGATLTMALNTRDVMAAAIDSSSRDVALYQTGDELILVSARSLGGEAQVRVLVRDASGTWHGGTWSNVLPQQFTSLQWSRDATGALRAGVKVE